MNKIAIIDSGLGGLTIHAMLYKRLVGNKNRNIELAYFNVQPKNGVLYRYLSKSQSIVFFNEMLTHIIAYKPQQILIACNTLTALYPNTPVSKRVKTPVLGIIDLGVRMVVDYAQKGMNREKTIVILGTKITIDSNLHKQKLIASGIPSNKVINQACWNLSDRIQKGEGLKIKEMIRTYLLEAKEKMVEKPKDLVFVLCCTHFQIAQLAIQRIGQDLFNMNVHILNPNEAMSQAVPISFKQDEKLDCDITNKCYSNPTLSKEEISTLRTVLGNDASAIYQALQNYQPL